MSDGWHPPSEWARGWALTIKRRLFCKGPTPWPTPTRGGPTHSQAIGACPLPFSFASVRARTQDHRDILKWGALSLPTGLVAQFVVRVLPISICPCGLGFELSRRRKKRTRDMPLQPVSEWDHPSSEWAMGWGPYRSALALNRTGVL